MPNLFVFDLDKTALPKLRQLEPHLPDAVARAQAAGHLCMIATARPMASSRWVWEALGLRTPICLCNGALIAHPGDPAYPITQRYLPADAATAAVDFAFSACPDVHIYYENGDDFYTTRQPTGYFAMVAGDCNTRFFDRTARPDCPASRIGFYVKTEAEHLRLADHFAADPNLFVYRVYQPKTGEYRCVISRRDVNKWYAIEQVAGELGIPTQQIVTFGDGWNDEMMLARAGRGYALLDTEAAASAPRTTRLTCEAGGVADMIDRLVQGLADDRE